MTAVQIPNHLGIILDGNRRWAKARNIPTLEGHRQGAEVFKDIAVYAFEKGISYVSAFVFSTENWSRAQEEVSYLMKLVIKATQHYLDEFHKKNIKIVILGSKKGLDTSVLSALKKTEEKTIHNTGGTLALCFNYGGKQEIQEAVNKAFAQKKSQLTEADIEQNLYSPDIPDVDLIIRSSGEYRTSGFMLWRSAYAELYITERMWPEFTKNDLDAALEEYSTRNRRYGG